ncbi:Alpha/Beta hydrolase protein [Gloeopeniophorella convolvens]|nr:Alpha/Beta hydrolase protein [Gloeopeniophorella convolvens]
MDNYTDVPYASVPHPLHRFDLFVPPQSPHAPAPPLICFVHGGAWRSEDKSDHHVLARSLATHTSFPVAVPNYRLTKPDDKLQHPAHAEDILHFLTFLLTWQGPPGRPSLPYDTQRIIVMGHSCSAHMLACILLDSSEPSLTPSAALLKAITGVVLSEGIFNIDTLLESFPTYKDWFLANTFGDLPSYDRYSLTKMPLRVGAEHTRWIIIHSKGDTLVDMRQSEDMYTHLQSFQNGGTLQSGALLKNWDDLEGDHNAILRSEGFVRIAGDFILSSSAV